jgi:hypothetical protein
MPTWIGRPTFEAVYQNNTSSVDLDNVLFTSFNPEIADINEDGKIQAYSAGLAKIVGVYEGHVDTFCVKVTEPFLAMEKIEVDPYLFDSGECPVNEIPVVIISFVPTKDGLNLDTDIAPDYWWLNPMTVDDTKQRILDFDQRIKFSLEEGSKFRDYAENTERPYLGYKVVDYFIIYEPTPRGPVLWTDANGFPVYGVDYHALFDRLDLQKYVEEQGVKEVWIWDYLMYSTIPSYDPNIHDPCQFRSQWESNMSSPTTNDISNSTRDPNDLPIYDKTYVVYSQNYRRTQAQAVHNRGHQYEQMLAHINSLQDGNTDLFWKKFVGQDEFGQWTTGRAGWTHMPPNTTGDYNYFSPDLVLSDIEDWTPDGSGDHKLVNVDTWANMPYQWPGDPFFPEKTESQWYIYWFQSFPGYNNQIPYGLTCMSNWWDIIYDWDAAIIDGYGLYNYAPCSGEEIIDDADGDGEYDDCDLCPYDIENDADEDGICESEDNCDLDYNPNQEDLDGDAVGDECDVCPIVDDQVDMNGDGMPDCLYPPDYEVILEEWKCGKNKVYVSWTLPNGKVKTQCVSYNSLPSKLKNGRFLGLPNIDHIDFRSIEDNVSFQVYPNPASEVLYVKGTESGLVDIKLYGIDGKMVYSGRHLGEDMIPIDLNDYKSGIYIIEMQYKSFSMNSKIIIKN